MIIIAEKRKLKMSEVLCHPLGPLPWALASADGSLRAVSRNATNSSTYLSSDTSKASSKQEKTATFVWIKLKVKQTEQLASAIAKIWRSERQRLSLRLERTPDFQRESTRLCEKSKKCFRRIESLIKRSKDYEEGNTD